LPTLGSGPPSSVVLDQASCVPTIEASAARKLSGGITLTVALAQHPTKPLPPSGPSLSVVPDVNPCLSTLNPKALSFLESISEADVDEVFECESTEGLEEASGLVMSNWVAQL
jgi:hypothetical protein